MSMTERQRTFLAQFWELYRDFRAPLHYSVVAEKLRISNISAYDMLCLLKRKGMIASQYLLPKNRPGPGRSTVVFYPTQRAKALFAGSLSDEGERREWEDLRDKTLQALRRGRDGYEQMLEDLLARIPERQSPMLHTTEVMTALVLYVSQLGGGAKSRVLKEMRRLMAAGESGLAALAGLPLGLMFVDDAERAFATRLMSLVEGYQENLSKLSSDSKKALSEFFLDVVRAVEGEKV